MKRDWQEQVDTSAEEPLEYEEFRTFLTYHEVYHMIYERRWKRRHGVLGKWKEVKGKMYKEYVRVFWYAKMMMEEERNRTGTE